MPKNSVHRNLLNEDDSLLMQIPDVLLDNTASNREKKEAIMKEELISRFNKVLNNLKKENDKTFKQRLDAELLLKKCKNEKNSIEKQIKTFEDELIGINNEILIVNYEIIEKEKEKENAMKEE